jgi:hypothetical protein
MDAPPATSERRRELAELRSRAYGPDADIDRDADALARLIELEDLARADTPPADADTPEQGGSPAVAPKAEPSPPAAGEESQDERADSSRSRRRRIPIWAYIAVAAGLGLGAGLAMPALTPPHPVATLRQAPPADGVELDFDMYGIPAESPMRYEPFRDLEVWSAETEQGSTCVVITADDAEWMAAGCAPAPLNPTADITYYPGMRGIEGLELADGSVVRFILRGDVMEVWLAETDEAA